MKKYIFIILPLLLGVLVCNNVEAKKKKYPNGNRYEGEWKEGAPNGNGKMTYANGDIYVGNWISGDRYGDGKMTYPNGDVYNGNWRGNMHNGDGKMTYSNGDIYEGNWHNGKCDGKGQIIYANGKTYKGFWDKGILIYIVKNTPLGVWEIDYSNGEVGNTGRLRLSNNCTYIGGLSNDLPSGKGKLNISSTYLEGDWKDGKLISLNEKMIKTNVATYPIDLKDDSLSIQINYPNKTFEKLKYGNSIQELSILNQEFILKEGKLKQYQQEELERQKALKCEEERKQKAHERYLKQKEEYYARKKEEEQQRIINEKEKEQQRKKEKQRLTSKYGIKYAEAILNNKIKIGMTKAMLDEMEYSWNTTKRTTTSGVVEIWKGTRNGAALLSLFSNGYYAPRGYRITIINGKVTEIYED